MKLFSVGFLWLLHSTSLFAEKHLSGKIQDTLLTAGQTPYIVTSSVIVPTGKKLVLPAGCVIIFKPFTDITIEGTFIVEGTPEKPVVFTSENDPRHNPSSPQFPNPFDWNGILINQNAEKVRLTNFNIKYSVYGIKSYKSDIIIENGLFEHNGQSNLTINEIMKNVVDGISFSYTEEPWNTTGQTTQPIKKPIQWKKVTSYGCVGGGVISLCGTTYFLAQGIINGYKYLDLDQDQSSMEKYKARRNSSRVYALVCAIPTIALGTAAVKLLKSNNKGTEQQSALIIVPPNGQNAAFSLIVDF